MGLRSTFSNSDKKKEVFLFYFSYLKNYAEDL